MALLGLLFAAGVAQADLLWDGVYEVPAVFKGNGRWLTCPKGAHFVYEKGSFNSVNKSTCYEGALLTSPVGAPLERDLQGTLDVHATPSAGTRYLAVGPLPVARGSASSSKDWLHIAFKIVKD